MRSFAFADLLAGKPASAGGRLKAVDEIGCALRVAGRGEDRAVVSLEDFE